MKAQSRNSAAWFPKSTIWSPNSSACPTPNSARCAASSRRGLTAALRRTTSARSIRGGARGVQAHAGHAPLRCAAHRRDYAASGQDSRMRTGEGKTLVATLPAYLNAIGGAGVHIVTVNDYLARRTPMDGRNLSLPRHIRGRIAARIGVYLRPGRRTSERGMENMRRVERREAYAATSPTARTTSSASTICAIIWWWMCPCASKAGAVSLSWMRWTTSDRRSAHAAYHQRAGAAVPQRVPALRALALTLKREDDYTIDEKHRTAALTNEGITSLRGC